MKNILIKLNNYNIHQKIIISLILTSILPYYLFIPIFFLGILGLLISKKLQVNDLNFHLDPLLITFSLVSLLVSLFYQNYLGCLFALGIPLVWLVFGYIQDYLEPDTFEFILDLLIYISIYWALVGIFEEYHILQRLNKGNFTLHIYSRRENRINSVFANANYYAMVIEFLIPIIFYKYTQTKSLLKKISYLLISILNLIMLYYTGCRTGIMALIIGLLVYLILDKRYKTLIICSSFLLISLVILKLKPSYIPRISFLEKNLKMRQAIWTTSIQGIKKHFFLGQGPFTYLLSYQKYNGYITHHSHNIFLDFFMNYGLIGSLIGFSYLIKQVTTKYYRLKSNQAHFALVVSLIVIVLIHGLFDVTIVFVQPIIIFGFILASWKVFNEPKA